MAKILWITECYPSKDLPQYCIFLEQQIQALIKLGHEVDVLIPRKQDNKFESISYSYNNIVIFDVGYSTDKYNISLSKGTKVLRNELERISTIKKYDIFNVHIVSEAVYYSVNKVSQKLSIKSILTFHGLNVFNNYNSRNTPLNLFYRNRKKRLFLKADAIIGVSNKVKNIIKNEIKNIPVYTVYNGVDTDIFFPNYKVKSNKEEISIVAIGNLIAIKGFNYLVDAIDMLVKEGMKIRVYILGRGKEKENLSKQIKALNLQGRIELVGYKPYNIVKEYLQNSEIFILPSYFEAIGCVYLESMACGIATIGVKGQGIDEIIIDEYNGLLVEPKSVKSIYEKLKLLIDNQELRKKISENGRITANEFTWEKSAENIENIYYKVLQIEKN